VGSRQYDDPVDAELRVLVGNRSIERPGGDDGKLQRTELLWSADLRRFLGDHIEDVACPVDGCVVRKPPLPCADGPATCKAAESADDHRRARRIGRARISIDALEVGVTSVEFRL